MKPILLFILFLTVGQIVTAQEPIMDTVVATTDSSELYGLIPELPVKVGGGPAKQRQYLEALRDGQDEPVQFERQGSCCAYKSANSPLGWALVDRYQVIYQDETGKRRKTIIYISFYDYETPRAVKGFKLVREY